MGSFDRNLSRCTAALALLWLGLLLGVSFIATPAKFLAPSLSLPVALDVGRQTFKLFSSVEIGIASLLAASALLGTWSRRAIFLVCVVAAIVMLQKLWLLPLLDLRVGSILEGGTPAASQLHEIYIGLEVAKGAVLALLAWGMLRGSSEDEGGSGGRGR